MRTPTDAQLRYLIAALEHSTWAEASAVCGVSASAFSQGLAALESRLGLPLFEARGRSRVPTDHAQAIARHGERILAELARLDDYATEARDGRRGVLRAGMIDTAAIHHFGESLVRYRRARPDVELRLTVAPSAELIDAVVAGDLDFAIVVAPEPSDELSIDVVLDEPLRIYPPPGTADGIDRDPARWGPWVTFPSGSRTRQIIRSALSRSGAHFDVVAESSQPAVLREMVRLGMGWTVLSAVDAETEPHALVALPGEPLALRTLATIRRPTAPMGKTTQALLDDLG